MAWRGLPLSKTTSYPEKGLPMPNEAFRSRSGAGSTGAFGGVGSLIRAGGGKVLNLILGDTEGEREFRDRSEMIKEVKRSWITGYLDSSLRGPRIEIGFSVERPISELENGIVPLLEGSRSLAILGATALKVFQEVGQPMLILGRPGAGKTTFLLEFARDMLAIAESDDSQPIPIYLSLSSWNADRDLESWLVSELDLRYLVPRRTTLRWLEKREMLLLLDGLDALDIRRRSACVAAFDSFYSARAIPYVMTCRLGEYQELSTPPRVRSVAVLQDVTRIEIEKYLDQAGRNLVGLRDEIEGNSSLAEMAGTPLMLKVLVRSYSTIPFSGSSFSEADHSKLLKTFVAETFALHSYDEHQRSRAMNWLAWLARALSRSKQGEIFAVETMQPTWLGNEGERWWYAICSCVIGVLALAFLGASSGKELGLGLLPTLGIAIAQGCFLGLIYGAGLQWGPDNERGRLWRWIRGLVYFSVVTWTTLWISNVAVKGNFEVSQVQVIAGSILMGIFFTLIFGRWHPRYGAVRLGNPLSWSWSGARRGLIFGSALSALATALGPFVLVHIRWTIPVVAEVFFANVIIFGLLSGLGAGIYDKSVEAKKKPPTVIADALLRSTNSGLIAAILVGIWFWYASVYDMGVGGGFISGLGRALPQMAPIAVVVALRFGGLDLIRHLCIRWIAFLRNHIPLDYSNFLESIRGLGLLMPTGNGYIFQHKFIQDYFAELETEKSGKNVNSPASIWREMADAGKRFFRERMSPQWMATLGVIAILTLLAYLPSVARAREVWRLYDEGENSVLRGDLDRAIELHRQVLVLNPEFRPAAYSLIPTLVRRFAERHDKADCREASELVSRFGMSISYLGMCQEEAGATPSNE
jgi:hypothetical protein